MKENHTSIKFSKENKEKMKTLFPSGQKSELNNYIGGTNGLLALAATVAVANKMTPEDAKHNLRGDPSITRTLQIDKEALSYVSERELSDEDINKLIDVGLDLIFEKIDLNNDISGMEKSFLKALSDGSFFPSNR
jgi:hypothetical protein